MLAAAEGRMFALDTQTFIQVGAQIINLAILAFFMVRFLYKPVRNALAKRAEKVQAMLDEAAGEMAEVAELKATYKRKIEEVQGERDEILSEARRLASETSIRLISEAKKEAEHIKERAAAGMELEWERAESDMRAAIIDISSIMAEKMVKLSMSKEAGDKLFDETISDLEGFKWKG